MAICYNLISCEPSAYPDVTGVTHADLSGENGNIVTINGVADQFYHVQERSQLFIARAFDRIAFLGDPAGEFNDTPTSTYFLSHLLTSLVLDGTEYVTGTLPTSDTIIFGGVDFVTCTGLSCVSSTYATGANNYNDLTDYLSTQLAAIDAPVTTHLYEEGIVFDFPTGSSLTIDIFKDGFGVVGDYVIHTDATGVVTGYTLNDVELTNYGAPTVTQETYHPTCTALTSVDSSQADCPVTQEPAANFSVCLADKCKTLTVQDTTGLYDATTNTGGWDANNTEILTSAEIIITFPDATVITHDVTSQVPDPITGIFNYTLNNGEDVFPDGAYKILYRLTYTSGTVNETETCVYFTCNIKCSLSGLWAKVAAADCGCDPCSSNELMESALLAEGLYRALISAVSCAKTDTADDLLVSLNRLFDFNDCNCS